MMSKSFCRIFLLSCAVGACTLGGAQTSTPTTPGSHLAPCVPVNNGSGKQAQYHPGTPSNPPSSLPATTAPGTTTPCVAQDGTVVTPSSSGQTGTPLQSGSQRSAGSQSGSSQPGSRMGGKGSPAPNSTSPNSTSPHTNSPNSNSPNSNSPTTASPNTNSPNTTTKPQTPPPASGGNPPPQAR